MIWLWIGFIAFVLALLAIDLGLLHRSAQTVSTRSALRWVAFFVVLALMFNVAVYFIYHHNWLGFGANFAEHVRHTETQQLVLAKRLTPEGVATWVPTPGSPVAEAVANPGKTAAIQFLTGWLTEYALSIDNIFVIALIFTHFRVPPQNQRRVLFWGIMGALVMRGGMILGGTALIEQFHWLLYVFGAFLVFTALKMALTKESEDEDFENMRIIRLAKRIMPFSNEYDGQKFFTRLKDTGALAATPLLLVLIIVEFTDVVFALDSIPAILGITTDPFLVFTSNVFAILGLRSLFFALAGLMDKFHYLKYSLAAILGFVGLKMLLEMPWIGLDISSAISLGVIAFSLAAGVAASLAFSPSHPLPASSTGPGNGAPS